MGCSQHKTQGKYSFHRILSASCQVVLIAVTTRKRLVLGSFHYVEGRQRVNKFNMMSEKVMMAKEKDR